MGLVLSRHVGQRVLIGDDIKILVTEIKAGGKVSLHIEAPIGVSVDREEVRIKKEQARG